MVRPEIWTLAQLRAADLGRVAIWSTPSVAERVTRELGPLRAPGDLDNVDTLIVVGGGTLIDFAKSVRPKNVRLVAIPSIWGSGAEASPIAVLPDGIRIDDALLPDVRVLWPELGESVPPQRAREACGDTWAHAIEGFLSPLATDELRDEVGSIIDKLIVLPIGYDPRWFDVSARACAAQARSSVGLVHGIAHVLETPQWNHARLCATWLLPVLRFNAAHSDRMRTLLGDETLERVEEKATQLFEADAFEETRRALIERWPQVLRNPSTRTNVVLVRPAHLRFFEELHVAPARDAAVQ